MRLELRNLTSAGTVLCACLLILVIGSTRLSTLPTTDEPHFLIAAHSIAYDGDLDLSNNYDLFAKWQAVVRTAQAGHVAVGSSSAAS
jgi:hypothetical protein